MIENGPKVSIIIPVYNGQKTLEQCLDSVSDQTYKNYSIFVVDNNSSDLTKDIIKKFEVKNNKIKYLFEKNKSVGSARNTGIKNAEGEIFLFTDSDCIAPKNWIEEMVKPIIFEKESVVMGGGENMIINYWAESIQRGDENYIERCLRGKYINTIDGKNFAADAGLIKELLFDPNIKMLDDFDLYIRLKNRTKIRFLPKIKVAHFHKCSFFKTAKMNFVRGFWIKKVYNKYSDKSEKNIVNFESISIRNNLTFPLWMALQLFRNNPKRSFFIFVCELSWRAGLILSLIKKDL